MTGSKTSASFKQQGPASGPPSGSPGSTKRWKGYPGTAVPRFTAMRRPQRPSKGSTTSDPESKGAV
eukprot:15530679-Heterocapsa_arctica.AAC.1